MGAILVFSEQRPPTGTSPWEGRVLETAADIWRSLKHKRFWEAGKIRGKIGARESTSLPTALKECFNIMLVKQG